MLFQPKLDDGIILHVFLENMFPKTQQFVMHAYYPILATSYKYFKEVLRDNMDRTCAADFVSLQSHLSILWQDEITNITYEFNKCETWCKRNLCLGICKQIVVKNLKLCAAISVLLIPFRTTWSFILSQQNLIEGTKFMFLGENISKTQQFVLLADNFVVPMSYE